MNWEQAKQMARTYGALLDDGWTEDEIADAIMNDCRTTQEVRQWLETHGPRR